MERLRLRQQREQEAAFQRGAFKPVSIRPPGGTDADKEGGSGMKETVDKVLIADFFFVLFAAVWLVAGLGVKFASESEVWPPCSWQIAALHDAPWFGRLSAAAQLPEHCCVCTAGAADALVGALAIRLPARHRGAHARDGERADCMGVPVCSRGAIL